MSTFRELEVWQQSMALAEKIYSCTRNFPKEELYGLTSQIRRAAVSIAANIAEGAGRESHAEYCHFISIAYGSCCEAETLCELAERLNLFEKNDAKNISLALANIGRMLRALRKSIRKIAA